jgi:Cyclic nucleotide-binding domain
MPADGQNADRNWIRPWMLYGSDICAKLYTRSARTQTSGTRGAMPGNGEQKFDVKAFLSTIGEGITNVDWRKGKTVFAQGDPADALFYIQRGKVKVTTVSAQGKEAFVAILDAGDFFGEGCMAVAYPVNSGNSLSPIRASEWARGRY